MMIEGKVKSLIVDAGSLRAGQLGHDSRYRFTYDGLSEVDQQVSLGMPVQAAQYTYGALFPIFQMNLPEGFVRHFIADRMRKQARVDDMLFLALAGQTGTGRLTYHLADTDPLPMEPVTLADVLAPDAKGDLFRHLVETYLLRTTAGISGVQPKVVIPDSVGGKASLVLPSLIVKTGQQGYPHLAVNEFICLSIARCAGQNTPSFWLSEDHARLVVRRFDIRGDTKLGMEDFSVLLNRPGNMKYQGSYDTLMKVAVNYSLDKTALFDRIALSLILGDGDAHLKNFAVLYESPVQAIRLAPVYDVVNTRLYGDTTMALSLDKSRAPATCEQLMRFGERHGVVDAHQRIEHLVDAAFQVFDEKASLLSDYPALRDSLVASVNGARAISHTGFRRTPR